MPVRIDDAYYTQVGTKLRECAIEEFSNTVREHKENMLAAHFNEPSEKVFEQNRSWIAGAIISQSLRPRKYKEAGDITDDDMRKLEILKAEFGLDYMKDFLIHFDAKWAGQGLEYTAPFLLYLAGREKDLSDYQAELIEQLIAQLDSAGQKGDLGVHYVMHAGRFSHDNNEGKNLFHVLMQEKLAPNKRKIADLVAPELANKNYRLFAGIETLQGSYGREICRPRQTSRNALHTAVSSASIENVAYALSKGAAQFAHDGFGSTAFADAVARSGDPVYHAIAEMLFENALTLKDGAVILRAATRWEEASDRPVEILANKGDVAFTIAIGRANAGDPEGAVQALNDGPAHAIRDPAEYQAFDAEKAEDPFRYIKAAAFNLNPRTGYYAVYKNIFGSAVRYLVDKEALNGEEIPENSLTDRRFLNFIFSMRAAAAAEKGRDPSFLERTAVFPDGFAAEMRKARTTTNNFRVVYDPDHPHETAAKAYDDEALSAGRPVTVKGPLQLKKPGSGNAR